MSSGTNKIYREVSLSCISESNEFHGCQSTIFPHLELFYNAHQSVCAVPFYCLPYYSKVFIFHTTNFMLSNNIYSLPFYIANFFSFACSCLRISFHKGAKKMAQNEENMKTFLKKRIMNAIKTAIEKRRKYKLALVTV